MSGGRVPVPAHERVLRRCVPAQGGCVVFTGHKDRDGYGTVAMGRAHKPHDARVHRVVYEALVGPIAPGMVIDHLCRNRACVNPAHLEQVTATENNLRSNIFAARTHCAKGHELAGDNLVNVSSGRRKCKTCNRDYQREWKERRNVLA